ncbi:hypothetical protein HMSSN036_52500 [Paenibacillus macerans]|nr:hypothetical protein HMSSN036_52500 [Paenibacillus macerans]
MARMGRPPKAENEKKARESMYLDADVMEWLKQKADEEDRTVSAVANRILKEKMTTEA